ncbi:MAG: GNAT family N-acetyltransferase [Chloroflexota bacterium]
MAGSSPLATDRLVLVAAQADAPAPEPGTISIVIDTSWTPRPSDRSDVRSVRAASSAVLDRVDLFEEARVRLDEWAGRARMIERLAVDDVSHWYPAREKLWNWLHERLLWRSVVAQLMSGRRSIELVVDVDEPALVDVARALGAGGRAEVSFGDRARPDPAVSEPVPMGGRPGPFRRWVEWRSRRARTKELRRRERLLADRVTSLAGSSEAVILVLSHMGLRQRIGPGADLRSADPNLGSTIDLLRADGRAPVVVGLGSDHRSDDDWPGILSDDRLLPASLLLTRWAGRDEALAQAPDWMLAALAGLEDIPLDVDGVDLGPALAAEVRAFAAGGLLTTLRQLTRVRRLLDEIRPGAILLSHEGIRIAWLSAARERGIPTLAVQHGVIYPTHPGYRREHAPSLVLPTRTFVFGDYERRVLLEHGGYLGDEVVVSGSPRLQLGAHEPADAGELAAERSAVRRELGIADGDRILVVSTVFVPFVRQFYFAHVLERLLGGPLPGIHVVFKLHPGEDDEGPYRALLDGLAAAGAYPAPPMTIVRDVDLYRLLRAADAHLGFHSTVLTDAVIVGTLNLIAATQAYGDLLGYVAAGVARPIKDIADLRAALADPRPADGAARSAFLADHLRPGDASGRIVATVRSVAGRVAETVMILPATADDEAILLDWANEPETRRASGDRAEIPVTTHGDWLARRLAEPSECRIWIGRSAGRPIGVVRFDRRGDRSFEVSITIAPEVRGRGLSAALLDLGLMAAREAFDGPGFTARVRADNARSRTLFERAGFRPAPSEVGDVGEVGEVGWVHLEVDR